MRAMALTRTSDRDELPDAMSWVELPDPVAGTGQLLVRVAASALNPTDYQRAFYGVGREMPFVLGLDVAGVVEAVGDGVDGFAVGDRIAYVGDIRENGGYAELTVADARAVAHVPESVSFVAATAVASAAVTAYQAVVRRMNVAPGDTVFVTGAAGGVGGFAVQLASLRGARVLASDVSDMADHIRRLGAEAVIDFRAEDVAARVKELTGGRGVDAILDTVGSESATGNLSLLAHGGGIATVAGRPDLTVVPPFGMAPSVHEIALGAAYVVDDSRAMTALGDMLQELLALVAAGDLDPMVGRVIELDEVPTALRDLGRVGIAGKVVAVWDDDAYTAPHGA